MIVDTSALVAILYQEQDGKRFSDALSLKGVEYRMSAGNWLELTAVLQRAGDEEARREGDTLISEAAIRIEPFTVEQAAIARDAYRRFGKGSGLPGKLNFGDCFAYALAKARGEPLLFKGNDFTHTDVLKADRSSDRDGILSF